MTQGHPLIGALRDAVGMAELRSQVACRQALAQPADSSSFLQDLRTHIAGDLCDALDSLDAGLGARLMKAMHPTVDFSEVGTPA